MVREKATRSLAGLRPIKKLEAKTNKSIPKKYLDELEIINDDNETPVITLIDVPAEHGAVK
jgi:hypothetical protein